MVRLAIMVWLVGSVALIVFLAKADSQVRADEDWEVNTYWVHGDRLGTPVKITDSSGAVVWETWYEPFGNTYLLNEDPDGDGENVAMNVRFPGQYFDAEKGNNDCRSPTV